MLLNTGVHILMYWYYASKTVGVEPWWKKHLTQIQITQFGINICVGLGKLYVILKLNFSLVLLEQRLQLLW